MDSDRSEEVERLLAEMAIADDRADTLGRCRILLQLAQLGVPLPEMKRYLDDSEPMVRVAAAQMRWQTGADREELTRLAALLGNELMDPDTEIALMAGTALVEMGEVVVPHLIRAFDEGSPIAPLVTRVLGEIGDAVAVEFLVDLEHSERPEVAGEAREALQALADEAGLEAD